MHHKANVPTIINNIPYAMGFDAYIYVKYNVYTISIDCNAISQNWWIQTVKL